MIANTAVTAIMTTATMVIVVIIMVILLVVRRGSRRCRGSGRDSWGVGRGIVRHW